MDLASVMDEAENAKITKNLKYNTWIGLYRKPWAYWSDRMSVNFTLWDTRQPNTRYRGCVVMNTHTGKWADKYCSDKSLPFFCQGEPEQARLKMKISSGADVNDPQVQRQLLQQVRRWSTISLP